MAGLQGRLLEHALWLVHKIGYWAHSVAGSQSRLLTHSVAGSQGRLLTHSVAGLQGRLLTLCGWFTR